MPFWPLLGALIAGVLIAARQPAARAHLPVVGGCLVTALLGVALFFDLAPSADPGGHAAADAQAEIVPAALAQDPHAAPPDAHVTPQRTIESAPAGAGEHATHALPGVTHTLMHWISLGAVESLEAARWIDVNFYFDGLTSVMMLFVSVVALMVVIYAIGYMRDHHGHVVRGYERFFAFLGLFVFSMAMLVLAGNFVLLYLGWEAVGLCSYLLIGFHYSKPSAAAAAKKAFLVNRIGDFGFALGIFALYGFMQGIVLPGENPLDYEVVFRYAAAGALTEGQLTLVGLLLLCGALGKSAQLPLYVWLPDAMEGPTPVSALIHAATMVTAGVYMIARCGPIFAASEVTLAVIVVIGVAGALFAASMAMAQYDMKRILAYSTISQLAYMFAALGFGAPDAAVFHVFTHAFFKALLFLCAGSVMHAMGDVIDLRQFSGLKSILPKTQKLMLVGCLALAGFPLLSGFWSKDAIVHAGFNYHPIAGGLLLLTAFMTAYYTFRMYFLCFHGPTRLPKEAGDHPHESPPVMLRPLYFLAAGAVLVGFLGVGFKASASESFLGVLYPHGIIHQYLHDSSMIVDDAAHAGGGALLMYVSALLAIGGIGLAWVRYGAAPATDPDAALLGPVWGLWHAKYYVDEIYDRVFVRPLRALGEVCFAIDRNFVDGLVWFVSFVPRALGFVLMLFQRGALQGYALCMALGVALLFMLWNWMDAAA